MELVRGLGGVDGVWMSRAKVSRWALRAATLRKASTSRIWFIQKPISMLCRSITRALWHRKSDDATTAGQGLPITTLLGMAQQCHNYREDHTVHILASGRRDSQIAKLARCSDHRCTSICVIDVSSGDLSRSMTAQPTDRMSVLCSQDTFWPIE